VCNFPKSTATLPSLLPHGDVVTFFHEFGHAVHNLCSKTQYARFAGTSVERDFVEAPSQMLENHCFEPEVLRMMSGHYQDSKKQLPEDIIKKLGASKIANAGLFNARQLIFGMYVFIACL
jgi:Zn-dependent oligopeptidase